MNLECWRFFSLRVVGLAIVDFDKTGGLGRAEIATARVAIRVKERRKLLHCNLTRNIPMQLKHYSCTVISECVYCLSATELSVKLQAKIPTSLTSHLCSRFNAKFIPRGSVVNSRSGQVLPAT